MLSVSEKQIFTNNLSFPITRGDKITDTDNQTEGEMGLITTVDIEHFDKNGVKVGHIRINPDGTQDEIKV